MKCVFYAFICRVAYIPACVVMACYLAQPAAAAPQPSQTNLITNLTRLTFDQLSSEDGLPHNNVWSIIQDPQGFMWFGTRFGGLARYDGYEFRVFQHKENDPSSLSHNFVWTMHVDRHGTLWVGTNGGGLDRYDPKTETFIHYSYDLYDPNKIPHANVKSIFEDGDGNLWIGSNGGLSRYDRATDSFETIRHVQIDANSLSGNSVRTIAQNPATGKLWIGTRRNGISTYDKDSGNFTHYRHDPQDPDSLSNDAVNHIYFDSKGKAWVSTREGLNLFNPSTGGFTQYLSDPQNPDSLVGDWVNQVGEDTKGRFWVATLSGLDRLDQSSGKFIHTPSVYGDVKSLSDTAVNVFHQDVAGSIWFGTENGGLNRLSEFAAKFRFLQANPLSKFSLSGKIVHSLLVDSTGNLWIGTSNGLNHYDGTVITRYGLDPNNPDSLSHNSIKALAEDGMGNVWVGTIHGLNKVNAKGISSFKYADNAEAGHSLSGNNISALGTGGEGQLWVGINGVGLNHFSGNDLFSHHKVEDPTTGQAVSLYPKALAPAPSGDNVWVGTNNLGLVYFNHHTGGKVYALDEKHLGSELHNFVRAIRRGAQDRLWLATNQGIGVFDPVTCQIESWITEQEGLLSNTVMAIEFDDAGFLWAATTKGISKIHPDKRVMRSFSVEAYFYNAQFLPNAAAKDGNGNLFFGTDHGMLNFTPSTIMDNSYLPPVALTRLQIMGRDIVPSSENLHLRQAISISDKITLRPKDSIFSISFSALDFTASKHNQYAYMLDGYDNQWRKAMASSRIASYSNVPPGKYVLRVKAANSDGLWNDSGASIQVHVLPAWWQTPYFVIGVGGLIVFTIVGGFLGQQRLASSHRIELEGLVRERTHDLMYAKAEAEHANKIKSVFLSSMSHELRTPLNAIIGFSEAIIHEVFGKIENAKHKEYLHHILYSGSHLLSLINEILDLASIESGKLKIQEEEVSIESTIECAILLVRPNAEKGRVKLVINIHDDLPLLHSDGLRLKQILINLLSNAVKFTDPNGTVTIAALREDDGSVILQVSDTGIGMSVEELKKVMHPFERAESVETRRYEGTGLGLPITENLVKLLHGTFNIQSVSGLGTTVTITFPPEITLPHSVH